MTRNHGYMIYDTLFGTDEKSQIKPQMVDTWTVSPDNRLWTFTLRPGLEFHDGEPVTGEDVIASLQRWGKRDAMGQKLMTFVDRMDSPNPKTFRIFLREACGFVLEALGKPSSNVPFIMPKRVADTPAYKQIEDYIGSGPYVFKRDEFKPGDKAVYIKNAKYVPRKEAPSGTAGGKNVYVDRVEWNLALRDAQAQVNALAKGEVDILERPASRATSSCEGRQDVADRPSTRSASSTWAASITCTRRSTTRRCARRRWRRSRRSRSCARRSASRSSTARCPSMFTCGTPYGSAKGSDIQSKSNMKKAQELLKASGYDGTPIVIMKPTDLAAIQKLPDVAAQLLRQAGFKVDLQAMDWQTLVGRGARRRTRRRRAAGTCSSPPGRARHLEPDRQPDDRHARREVGWFGWPSDEKIEKLRDQFTRETDDAKKKKLAEAIQARAFEVATHAPLGEYANPLAARKNITRLRSAPRQHLLEPEEDRRLTERQRVGGCKSVAIR